MTIIQTTLAKDIEIENLDIRYDKSVKRVLANTPLLAPITKYTVRELKNYSIPMVEKCIDADSIQVSEVFVDPGLTNRKIVNDELESKIPGEGRAIFDIRFTITLPDGTVIDPSELKRPEDGERPMRPGEGPGDMENVEVSTAFILTAEGGTFGNISAAE